MPKKNKIKFVSCGKKKQKKLRQTPKGATAENKKLDNWLKKSLLENKKFFASAAHQLKTPLTSLRSEIEISLSKDRKIKEYKECLNLLLSDTDLVCHQLQDILDLTSAVNLKKVFKKIDLSQIVNEIREITEKLAFSKKIKVEGQVKDKVVICGHKPHLTQAVANIAANIVNCTGKNGKINLSLKTGQNRAKILISTDNFLIPKKELPFIFDHYHKHPDIISEPSPCLQMAIAKAIIVSHQGKVFAKKRNSQDTVFTIHLPASNLK